MVSLVIIPTYNERTNLPPLIERLLAVDELFDILVVDDNSPDGTGLWVEEQSKKNTNISLYGNTRTASTEEIRPFTPETELPKKSIFLLSRAQKNGLGRAYIAGFQWGLEHHYDVIVQMDADFSHNPDDLPRLIAPIKNKQAAFSIGSRYVHGVRVINWPLHRLILSVGASYYVHSITGMPIHDPTGGFKCWHRSTLENLSLETIESNGYGFQIEMNHRAWRNGFLCVEIPIIFTDRFQGTSKMSMKIVIEAFFMVFKLLFNNGFRRSPKKRK